MPLAALNAALAAILVLEGTSAVEEERSALPLVLPAPEPADVDPMRLGHAFPDEESTMYVRVVADEIPVFHKARKHGWGLGTLSRGAMLAATSVQWGDGCSQEWVELRGRGYVCRSDGVELIDGPQAEPLRVVAPDEAAPLPFRYAKIGEGAPLMSRPPRPDEVELLDGDGTSGPVIERVYGVMFRAIDRVVDDAPVPTLRLVDGTYVREQDVDPVDPPKATGQPLLSAELPFAFVIDDDAPVYELEGDDVRVVGRAQRYARFQVEEEREYDGRTLLSLSDGRAVAADAARVARRIPRPGKVPDDGRWVHVDLDEQVLVAYEGDRPVFVTLVSSGKQGHATPAGSYRIRRKYVARRMKGPDPDHGRYDIGNVPWTMYYYGGLAMHGAFWHDGFGDVRSHGCTNLPPSAARWLFEWSDPDVPRAWQGIHEAGTWVYLTRA